MFLISFESRQKMLPHYISLQALIWQALLGRSNHDWKGFKIMHRCKPYFDNFFLLEIRPKIKIFKPIFLTEILKKILGRSIID